MKAWLLFFPIVLFCQDFCSTDLFADLETVRQVEEKRDDRLPFMVNYLGQGGYFTMPSARAFDSGELGFGYSHVPPYHLWSLGFQWFDRLEATGNYWVFRNKLEGNFGHLGFGDDADRAANLKLILLKKEQGSPLFPEVAIGWNDFMGTRRFYSFYTAFTKQWIDWNLETTAGWGKGRIDGLYGGVIWTPFRKLPFFFKNLMLSAEYDGNRYEDHPDEHPLGRAVDSRINVGAQLCFGDLLRLSASSLRGREFAAGASFHYSFGSASELIPKTENPPLLIDPLNIQELNPFRKEREFASILASVFKEQGFDLYRMYLIPGKEETLWMKLINIRYRKIGEEKTRIENVLSSVIPSNIGQVITVVEAEGVPIYEYQFRAKDLHRYREGLLGEREFNILSPLKEAGKSPDPYSSIELYQRAKPIWTLTVRPWLKTFFGSSKGKFKYETGLIAGPEGYLFNQIYYSLQGSYTALSSVQDISASDRLNPSRIINVRTDSLKYNQASSFHVPQAFLQKSWNLGRGFYSRTALGYFEVAYGGVAFEGLYFPVNSSFAIGLQGATLLKRKYYGLGFQDRIRKWSPEGEVWSKYLGLQYFLQLYYELKPFQLNFKVSGGQFLARDKGVRFEGMRTFKSGLAMGLWYTLTNGGDVVNGKTYFDKGFAISLPLDFFLNKSSRSRIGYGMSAWLRDVGAVSATGRQLYQTLFWERYDKER